MIVAEKVTKIQIVDYLFNLNSGIRLAKKDIDRLPTLITEEQRLLL